MHKNSQKRYYGKGVYFLTCNTQQKFPYFENKILCNLWMQELSICKELKKFDLYAFCLNHDHFHVLLQPDEDIANISEIMRSLKTNSSRNFNRLIKNTAHKIPYLTQAWTRDHAFMDAHNLPKFQRQASFHDHIIRDKNDYKHHRYYTRDNYLKHDLPKDWKYQSGNVEYKNLLDHIHV